MATGLLDIALATEEVAGVQVKGVSARGISYLLRRFPELRMMMTGRAVNVAQLSSLAPEAIAAVIACGCGVEPTGELDDVKRQTKAEDKAASLPVAIQADFLEAILRLTMPGGVGPFVATLEKLGAFAAEGFGQVAAMKSPPQSLNADETASPTTSTPGT